jgi:CBS domain-containing protein
VYPQLLSTSAPMVQPEVQTLEAIRALLRDRLDVILLEKKSGKGMEVPPKGVSGYSIISRLAQGGESNLQRFASEPCLNSSLTLGTVSFENDDLKSLLYTFEVTSLGYAIVKTSADDGFQILSIIDLLSLYGKGILSSDLTVKDVASSPVLTVSRHETLFHSLSEMMRRKVRRLKMADSRWELISERDILEFVFQKDPSNQDGPGPWIVDQMRKPLSEIRLDPAPWVEQDSDLEDAARVLLKNPKTCALSQAGIITPWDVVLKAWRLGRLSFRQ